MLKIKQSFKQYIYDNKKIIFIMMLCFFIGTVLGIMYLHFIDNASKVELQEYIENNNNAIKNNENIVNAYTIIKSSFRINAIYMAIIMFLGCSIIFSKFIYIIYMYKGFSIAFSFTLIINLLGRLKGSIYGIISLFLPNMFFLLIIMFIGLIWINFAELVLKNKENDNIKKRIYINMSITISTFAILCIIMCPLQILISVLLKKYIEIL